MVTVKSIRLNGIDGIPVDVECQISEGVGIHLVGLPDTSVKESLLRMATALQVKGYHLFGKKLILNIAPADLHKSGTGFDLPMAIAFIAESGQERLNDLDQWIVLGELGLDGSVREVPGCVQAIQQGIEMGAKGVIIPSGNAPEVANVFANAIPIYGVKDLREAVKVLPGEKKDTVWEEYLKTPSEKMTKTADNDFRWKTISPSVQRALEIAAAGGHNILLVGPPGSGKTTAAIALHALLPRLSANDVEEVAAIYSACSYRKGKSVEERPFRAPNISSSLRAFFGGGEGNNIGPGEVSLAHKGVLFLDEIIEAPSAIQSALSVILEDHRITIHRLHNDVELPADFQFVGSSNLCPCGYFGDGDRCVCTPHQRRRYLEHLQPSIYDHLTMQVFTQSEWPPSSANEPFDNVRERVEWARQVQARRYAGCGYSLNERVPSQDIEKMAALGQEEQDLLDKLVTSLGLSARSYTNILRIARTIADLEHSDEILGKHIAEASTFRCLDRMR